MLTVTGECSMALKRKLREAFPYAKVYVYKRSANHIRAYMEGEGITPQDEQNFCYAIRGHMPFGFDGKVSTPYGDIDFSDLT